MEGTLGKTVRHDPSRKMQVMLCLSVCVQMEATAVEIITVEDLNGMSTMEIHTNKEE